MDLDKVCEGFEYYRYCRMCHFESDYNVCYWCNKIIKKINKHHIKNKKDDFIISTYEQCKCIVNKCSQCQYYYVCKTHINLHLHSEECLKKKKKLNKYR